VINRSTLPLLADCDVGFGAALHCYPVTVSPPQRFCRSGSASKRQLVPDPCRLGQILGNSRPASRRQSRRSSWSESFSEQDFENTLSSLGQGSDVFHVLEHHVKQGKEASILSSVLGILKSPTNKIRQ
jgi:hypothetical protein